MHESSMKLIRRCVWSGTAETLSRHTLDTPPTSPHKITLRAKRNDLVSAATANTWLSAHTTAIVLLHPALLLLMLLDTSSAFIQF